MSEAVSEEGTRRAVMRAVGSGRGTWAMQSLFEHLVEAHETADDLGVAMVTQPPGVATPLHRHTKEAEAFFMLAGVMDYRAGDEMFHLEPGCFMYLPPALPHAFRIRGDDPARFLALTVPGGLLNLYDEVGLPATELRLPGADAVSPEVEIPKWVEVGPRYGLEVVGPPIPE
ncbi:MAG: cupin domain-containing protein [Nocardioides sp.]|uniref:cupin domain-containing protein n=1 Tax=Nocardioides sp. TaxID=35761 RepID=UPI0039E47E01